MLRRVLTFLALTCVLLGQFAQLALTHAHEHESPLGHDLRPHVHLVSHPHTHPHTHPHPHQDTSDADEDVPATPDRPFDHDADAVRIASIDVLPAGAAPDELGAGTLVASVAIVARWVLPVVSARAQEVRNRPPPGAACPLYVRHLAILI